MNRANIFLTRRCNMRCDGCNVINHKYEELSTDDWYNIFTILQNQGIQFIQLYGGEPTLIDDLPDLVTELNRIGLKHTVVTNSVRLLNDEQYYRRLLMVNPFGITCSHNEKGINLLEKLRNNYHGDLVANITITKHNIDHIPEILSHYTKLGIRSVLFFLHGGTGWEFRGTTNEQVDSIQDILSVAGWILENYDNLLLHNNIRYFESWKDYALELNWKCSDLTSLQVNCDGRISICQDKSPTQYSVFNISDEALQACIDQSKDCPGCFYDCYFEHDNMVRIHA